MKSLYGKLIVGFFFSIIISFSIAGYLSIRTHTQRLQKLAVERLESVANTIAYEIKLGDTQILNDIADTSGMNIVHVSKYGVATSYGNKFENIYVDDLISKAKNPGINVRGNETIVKLELKDGGRVYIRENISEELAIFQDAAMLALVTIFVSGTFIFLIISDIIVKPIKRLTNATNELSKGNYHVQVNYYGKDELATLSSSFNTMAKRLNKMEDNRQKFISDVSHEFQTPLTSIQGFAKILTAENVTDAQRIHFAKIILEQSKRLSTLSKNMMHLTLLESDEVKLEKIKYNLSEQLDNVVEMQRGLAKENNIDIEVIMPKNDVYIVADKYRMEQVFINVLNNAIKYTQSEGVVTLTLKKNLKDCEVIIEDTGVGMSEETVAHIFDRFYRADKSRSIQGNGLGMSIVKRLIDLHDFHIKVESQLDVGSVFTITIPIEVSLPIHIPTKD